MHRKEHMESSITNWADLLVDDKTKEIEISNPVTQQKLLVTIRELGFKEKSDCVTFAERIGKDGAFSFDYGEYVIGYLEKAIVNIKNLGKPTLTHLRALKASWGDALTPLVENPYGITTKVEILKKD